jgi:cytohesin
VAALSLLLAGGCTSMQKAARTGDVQTVIKGLAAGKDVNMVDATGSPLLALAAERGQLAVIRELVSRGADLEKKNGRSMTPLYIASGYNQLSAVQELVAAGANLESVNTELEMTPLMPAAESGYKAVVEYLLSKGAKVAARSTDKQTALSRLARTNARTSQSDGPGTAQLLLVRLRASNSKKAVADYINLADGSGFTALHRAAGSNNAEVITLLLQNGANPNIAATLPGNGELAASTPEVSAFAEPTVTGNVLGELLPQLQQTLSAAGKALRGTAPEAVVDTAVAAPVAAPSPIGNWSPLLSAAQHCEASEGSIKALLAGGANPLARASNGRTALQVLAGCGQGNVAAALKLVLDKGREKAAPEFRQFLNAQDEATGRTALMTTVAGNQTAAARLLLSAGAATGAVGKNGLAALHVALANGNLDLVKALLDARANPDLARGDGQMPLLWMVEQGNAPAVRLLLAAGAKPNLAAEGGTTPLHVAVTRGDEAMVEALLAAKANAEATLANGDQPLHLALANSRMGITKMLLAAGANPNRAGARGMPPLVDAVSRSDAGVAALLLTHGAKPGVLHQGVSPLYIAVQLNAAGMVRVLLDAGANPDVGVPAQAWTPLHRAASDGFMDIYSLLLAKGANQSLRNNASQTAADLYRLREERLAAEREAAREAARLAAEERAEASQRRAEMFMTGLNAFGSAYTNSMNEYQQQQSIAQANNARWAEAQASAAREREAQAAAQRAALQQRQADQQAAYSAQVAALQQQAANQQATNQALVAQRQAAATALAAQKSAERDARIAQQEREARANAARQMQGFVASSAAATSYGASGAGAGEAALGAVEPVKTAPVSRGKARAWCMRKPNGEFWCNGPLQSGGWGSSLKGALNMSGCPDGFGYEPTVGTGGKSFDCGRELTALDEVVPTYDPFFNQDKKY